MGNSTPLRHRSKAQKTPISPSSPKTPIQPPKPSSPFITLADILRVLSTLIALALSLSYYLTSGDSLIFNQPRPWYTQPSQLRALFAGPLSLTPAELSYYNGISSPQNPRARIILSLNHTLFDVSVSPHHYGPGGSYASMAGRDATRAFVTGCFQEDKARGADLRGVERMYLPVEDLSLEEEKEVVGDKGEGVTSGGRKGRREREGREARRRVAAEVQRWVGFYEGSAKYFKVGSLVGWEEIEGKEELGESGGLCKAAEGGRRKRSVLLKEEKDDREHGKRKVGNFGGGKDKGGKPV